jgi:hypothetical protein
MEPLMKLLSSLALSTLLGFVASPLMAAKQPALTGCAAKRQAISEQIEQARAHGNRTTGRAGNSLAK